MSLFVKMQELLKLNIPDITPKCLVSELHGSRAGIKVPKGCIIHLANTLTDAKSSEKYMAMVINSLYFIIMMKTWCFGDIICF